MSFYHQILHNAFIIVAISIRAAAYCSNARILVAHRRIAESLLILNLPNYHFVLWSIVYLVTANNSLSACSEYQIRTNNSNVFSSVVNDIYLFDNLFQNKKPKQVNKRKKVFHKVLIHRIANIDIIEMCSKYR